MKKYIIIAIFISVIYLVYLFRSDILWFFNVVKVTFLNKKGIKDLQKKGMNKRNLDNEEIKKYIEMSRKYLNRLNMKEDKKFTLNGELERHLRYSRFSEKYVKELLNEILMHMNLNDENIELNVKYVSSKYALKFVGAYSEKDKNFDKPMITINIKNDMTMENVISILAHECTHHLLISNNIRLENTRREECLTDVTTVLLGFGDFLVKGFEISNRVTYESEFKRYVDKNSIGYLTSNDIKYVMKHI